ncbi:Uu.00g031970.m01.CDS01 [Anthostomella pinea]|uniref:Uu.00g031970.m01.CDS01 n=1 Tax=Anthostomella pinea TaxID=933095 RepID=A0AAI8V8K8_9PEZI|nr:Uu.00g031970.m01.CDS01 [Anthostomella pinea]
MPMALHAPHARAIVLCEYSPPSPMSPSDHRCYRVDGPHGPSHGQRMFNQMLSKIDLDLEKYEQLLISTFWGNETELNVLTDATKQRVHE